MLEQLSIAFGIDYFKTREKLKVIQLFEILRDEGYSKQDLRICLKEFLKNTSYPTWTPSDFFKHQRPKIYTFTKVLELSGGTTKGFKAAKLNGETVWIEQEQIIQSPLEPFEPKVYRAVETKLIDRPTDRAKAMQFLQNIGLEINLQP